jgi:hypothetical protein
MDGWRSKGSTHSAYGIMYILIPTARRVWLVRYSHKSPIKDPPSLVSLWKCVHPDYKLGSLTYLCHLALIRSEEKRTTLLNLMDTTPVC